MIQNIFTYIIERIYLLFIGNTFHNNFFHKISFTDRGQFGNMTDNNPIKLIGIPFNIIIVFYNSALDIFICNNI